ncbi:glycogen debranching protein [Streptomyces sp. NBC_01275]|uniref:glycogen debranching N-terminal domain-containing protein n=1 Tax=Streptomyces sp. NBC_01275 TaxID=2903807 RepID=UPI00225088DF|nr:glycogen debranching N-terminal domain-containing protein [Streptomyces sp. NBC_01275]MCX4761128.1 glycogen debranching protein [Streptomyces sp. NBC_01275]
MRALQPLLHDVVICVAAPAFAASPRDGQLRGERAEGFYGHDRRLLHTARLLIDRREPEPIGVQPLGPDQVRFTSVHRYPEDSTDDPTVIIERVRTAGAGESVLLRNVGIVSRLLHVELTLATDLADIADVKRGRTGPAVPCTAARGGDAGAGTGADTSAGTGARGLVWETSSGRAEVRAVEPEGSPPLIADGPRGGAFSWPRLRLRPGESRLLRLTVDGGATPAPPGHPGAPGAEVPWSEPVVRGDHRLVALVRRGLSDLRALRLADPERTGPDGPEDQFIAAGCPWYLALFGRDSIWSARMMLPLGTDLARGTLWALARRQGTAHDDVREEAPGRILHELRPADAEHGHGLRLPSRYYGSVDATPLFVTLLVETWHWGLPDADVDALLPYAEAAMEWVLETSAGDEDGLLRYYPRPGGLRHQSWKDSEDAVRDAAGRRIEPPLALCEVQGYAYQAATGLAELLGSRGRADRKEQLLLWAEGLRKRFRDAFWLPSPDGPAPRYVAIAVGRGLDPVSGPASNMGQLLSTGILDADGCRDVAAWLACAELNSGWGLRSRSAALPGFNPMSYHGGSVWTHDTAIAVQGLCAAGQDREAGLLADGLLDAAAHFGYRMPELYGGDARTQDSPAPLAYPAACRPQGWSAASGVAVLSALLGLRPDAGRRVLQVRPTPFGPLKASGLRLAGREFSVRVDGQGRAKVSDLPPGWVTDG